MVLVMVKAIKNPRSALCKTSIMASSDIFKAFGLQLIESTSDAFNQLVIIPCFHSKLTSKFSINLVSSLAFWSEFTVVSPLTFLVSPLVQLLQLLLKASQDKKFVCEEAEKALLVMVESMSPLPLLHKLGAYVSHSNLRIRAKAAVSISNCVSKMVLENMNTATPEIVT